MIHGSGPGDGPARRSRRRLPATCGPGRAADRAVLFSRRCFKQRGARYGAMPTARRGGGMSGRMIDDRPRNRSMPLQQRPADRRRGPLPTSRPAAGAGRGGGDHPPAAACWRTACSAASARCMQRRRQHGRRVMTLAAMSGADGRASRRRRPAIVNGFRRGGPQLPSATTASTCGSWWRPKAPREIEATSWLEIEAKRPD